MIKHLVEVGYIKDYRKSDRLAIYAASIDMCTRLAEYLQEQYPKLDVRRYVGEDPYENVIVPDIRVSTILSSGTAVDIPMLTATILTINIDSLQANVQVLGRLRKLDGRDARFYYCWCEQLAKHRTYHERRDKSLLKRVKNIKQLAYPYAI
jgi:hypothetical protein